MYTLNLGYRAIMDIVDQDMFLILYYHFKISILLSTSFDHK